ncbi:MAG: pitrilysin family protein [Thermodesulfobacteriota bacterium]|nr:pitrilysin family protein [Thermodesulfobacteriota bacterium]
MRFQPKWSIRFFLCALTIFAGMATSHALEIKLDVKEFELENGMQFLVVERPTTPQVACRVAIRAGSALEQAGKTGIAHLLEHMMFKGTKNFGTLDVVKDQELQERIERAYQTILAEERKRRPDRDLIRKKLVEMDSLRLEVQKIYVPQAFSSNLERNGAVGINAFTSKDQTQYYMSVPSDMIEQWFSTVSEQLFEPSWREFYVEKEVIKREWAFRYINNARGAAWLDLNATAYHAHPYRNPTIGWRSDMEGYSTRDAIAFHSEYYNPANAVCVLVGDVTTAQAKRLAEVYFKRYAPGRRAPETVTDEPPQKGPRRSIRFLKGARTPIVRIGFHGPRMGTDDFYALDVMTMILSHGRSARITRNITNAGRAVQAWSGNPDNRYGGMVVLGGSPNEPATQDLQTPEAYVKDCEEFERMLLAEAERLKNEPVLSEELARIKKLNERGFLDRMRSNESLAETLATIEVLAGWNYLTTYLEKIDQIAPEDVVRVAKRYIREDNKTSVYVIPGGRPDRPAEQYSEIRSAGGTRHARPSQTDLSINRSIYPTHDAWKHPLTFSRVPEKIEYTKAEIAEMKGAKIFYLPDKELPLIDMTIFVKAGAVDVPADKIGLSGILDLSLMRGGTSRYSPEELAEAMDDRAIQISVSVREEETLIRMSVLRDDWRKGLSLLEEVLARPSFEPKVIEVAKKQILTSLKRQGGDAQALLSRESSIRHFKGHVYGRDPLEGLVTIPGIGAEDLRRFMKEHMVSSNMIVAVSGDIDKGDVLQGLMLFFEAFPETEALKRGIGDPTPPPPLFALIHKPGQLQSQVRLLLPSVVRTHPDFWKISLLMDIFGGSDSMMYTRLRDDLGLIYAGAFYQTYKWRAGILKGYIGCKADKTGQAIQETIDLMKGLHQGIPKEVLEQKRLDVLNGFVFNVDTAHELVNAYARYEMRREPLDTLARIQDVYLLTKADELANLARTFLDPKQLQIFVVGDKNRVLRGQDGEEVTLEKEMISLAESLGLPYKEIALR